MNKFQPARTNRIEQTKGAVAMPEHTETPDTTEVPPTVTRSTRNRRTILMVTFAVLSALLSVFAAPAASAAQGTRPCPSYYYCFYQDANYNAWNGTRYLTYGWRLQYQNTTYGNFASPPSSTGNKRDLLSSIINNTGKSICIYDFRPNNAGVYAPLRVAPYQDLLDLSRIGWNDRADYWKAVTSSTCPSS